MQGTDEQVIGIRELLEAGVHFGHQARRWNPKMRKYIFAQRSGVHIIDLDQTLSLLKRARGFVRDIAGAGREVLFVGTKKQAQYTVAEQAIRCDQPYVVERYIGGMLTNFQTIQPRIRYFETLRETVEGTPEGERTGRQWFALNREYQKLRRNFAGITEMDRLPGAVFVVDPKKEELLVKEANRLRIPVVALTDTNCDPDVVDYVIPGNDDAIRSINLICGLIADSIIEGQGGNTVAAEDRPAPPAVQEALVSEQTESIAEAAESGGVSEETPKGMADPERSSGEIGPEEDPTTSYRGAGASGERARRGEEMPEQAPGGPQTGREHTDRAEGAPGGDRRHGEETARSHEPAPAEEPSEFSEGRETEPPAGGEAARTGEATESDEE